MREREALAFNLKRLRQSKGLMQKELAGKVGLTKDTISKIELGKQENVGLKYLGLICRELDVSIEELFLEEAKKIKFELVLSNKNVETMKNMFDEFMRILAGKGSR